MTLSEINKAISADPGLSDAEKRHLSKEESQRDIEQFLAGGSGAIVGVVAAKYLKLSKPVQVILGLLGYGAGRSIYNFLKDENPAVKHNSKTQLYEIDSKRY